MAVIELGSVGARRLQVLITFVARRPASRHKAAVLRAPRRLVSAAAWDHRDVAGGARERREMMRQLAGLRGRLGAAEEALAGALAAKKQAEQAFDAASDQFDAAERALDTAREARAQARRELYAARQAYERSSTALDRMQRRVREMSERLDRMLE